jgi:hypothetical protein
MPIQVHAQHIAPASGLFEPQRTFDWSLEIHGLPGDDQQLVVLSLQAGFLPFGNNEEIEIPYGNERVWVAGKANWDRGQVICRDYVDRPVALALHTWRKTVYNPNDGTIGWATDYKKEADVVLTSPTGGSERIWHLVGLWPVAVNFAENGLDMANNDQVRIGIQMRYDRAYGLGDQPGGSMTTAVR